VVLTTLAGWALQRWAGVPEATVLGLFAGLIVARFVPGGSCAVPSRRPSMPE